MQNNKTIYIVSFFGGFLSLSQEILWMRLISFAGMSVPQTFSYTLALFLMGIAAGALIGKRVCGQYSEISLNVLGYIFFAAALVDLILIFLVYLFAATPGFIIVAGFFVFITATVRGIAFPIIHHIGTTAAKSGAQISNVYFANVFGSALAPLMISFIALEYFNTQQVYLIVCVASFVVAALCFSNRVLKFIAGVVSVLAILGLLLPEKIFFELSKNSYLENTYPSEILESKHGFIQVYDDHADKVVFGANVYDGKFNTDIFHNTNGIDRAYLLTAIQPEAKNALIIGLSTGSWAKVLSTMPSLEKITIIEINPDYIKLIKKQPEVADLLKDKRVEIIFDDGRKWLRKYQGKKFDIILMNTTWHWRAYGSNLLSQDFLMLAKKSLNKKGLVFYNTTQSLDAYYTAKQVFPKVYRYRFMVIGTDQAISLEEKELVRSLCNLKQPISQNPVFANIGRCAAAKDEILKNQFLPYEQIDFSILGRAPQLITDNNMIAEFKYGKGL